MNLANHFNLSPDVSTRDRYIHGTQLGLGALVLTEGVIGIVQETQSNGYGLAFTFGSLAMAHAYTKLRGGYSRGVTIATPEQEIVSTEEA